MIFDEILNEGIKNSISVPEEPENNDDHDPSEIIKKEMGMNMSLGSLEFKPVIVNCKSIKYMNKKSGIELISEERQRQIDVKGFTVKHDVDTYNDGILACAACHYASPEPSFVVRPVYFEHGDHAGEMPIRIFPFGLEHDNKEKHSRIEQLTIAGAFIAAEIDRIQAQEKFNDMQAGLQELKALDEDDDTLGLLNKE